MLYTRIKHWIFRFYGSIILFVLVLVTLCFAWSQRGKDEITIYLTIVGGLLSFFFLIQKQKLEELQLFKELFIAFNKRYDELNGEMNAIVGKQELSPEDKNILNDYFNLCAEEFLFYKKGYIYPEVWMAWHNGMKFYLRKSERIRDYWQDEMKTESYYGLIIKYDTNS